MLERIVLKNFQVHKRWSVDVEDRILTLIGPSDRGKSSIVRALRALCLNRFGGSSEAYVRHGADALSVKLTVDGKVVTRRKGGRVNLYLLGGSPYKSFGQSTVPGDVAALLNVDDANFARQHDAHFWFSDTPGQVSRNLNEIVNLSRIDAALAAAKSAVTKANSDVDSSETRFKEATERKKQLAWVGDFDVGLRKLEGLETELAEKRDYLASLTSELSQAGILRRDRDRASCAILAANKALRTGRRAAEAASELAELDKLLNEWSVTRRVRATPPPDIGPLAALRKRGDEFADWWRGLDAAVTEWAELRKSLCRSRTALSTASARLNRLRKKFRECPTCGRPMPSSSSPASATST